MKRKYMPPEQLAEVKKIDLLTYLSNYEPNELIMLSKNDYVTKTHSSLHIQNGMWMWWAHHIGGRSALDYLIKVEGFDFKDAAFLIHDCITKTPPVIRKQPSKKVKQYKFQLPEANENNDTIIDYLVNERKIDRVIVSDYIDRGYIYEAKGSHAVVFIGFNSFGEAKFASLRGTQDSLKKDVPGSDKQFSFSSTNDNSSVLHLFESTIDMLSYQTLLRHQNKAWRNENYLSLGGVSLLGKHIEDTEIPPALSRFLFLNRHITDIHLHLDNDRAGHDTTKKIEYHLENKYRIFDDHPEEFKDINEVLINKETYKFNYEVR